MDAGFFDEDYHRILEPFHPEAEARSEVAALRERVGLAQTDHVLDLGCGWGRHLALLREAGHDVVGVDRSLPLLRRGHVTGAAAGDMRALPFRDESFDGVINLATSLGLFLDDAPVLASLAEARRVLRPGGWLLLEGMHRDDVVADYAVRDAWTLDDGTEVRARRRFDALTGVSHEVLRWRGTDGRTRRKRHSLRLRTATEVAGLLERAGLKVRDAWGEWDGRPFRHDSPRLIVRAERE